MIRLVDENPKVVYFADPRTSPAMAKRHTLTAGDWNSVFGRLLELVSANSGADPFEAAFSLLVAKLWDEIGGGGPRRFRGGTGVRGRIADLLTEAAAGWGGTVAARPPAFSPSHLAVCVEAIEGLRFADAAGEALDGLFEHLVSETAKGKKGQFFTPRHVVDACVRMVDPRPGEAVVDPACGSGGFLSHAFRHMRGGSAEATGGGDGLWGFEYDPRAARVARVLLAVSGAAAATVAEVNSLLRPGGAASLFADPPEAGAAGGRTIEDVVRTAGGPGGGFDVLLANPPFAGDVRERGVLDAYAAGAGRSRVERDALFLERCVGLLRPGGRMAVVLPHNKFGGGAWAGLREWALRHVRVVAVLGLGRETFLPHTHQKAAVMLGVRRPRPLRAPPADEEILFLISERSGKDSRGRLVPRSPDLFRRDPGGGSAWDRADHDLGELVALFHDASEGRPWAPAGGAV